MNQNAGRAMIPAVAGGYVLYIAYDLLKNLTNGNTGSMPLWVFYVAIPFFAVAGGLCLWRAWKVWKGPPEEDPVTLEEDVQTDSGEAEQKENNDAAQ